MSDDQNKVVFDEKRAESYDRKSNGPVREALQFLVRTVLADLPQDARILCVGIGTGLELVDLAQAFPHWHFTAVEPAAPMMEICRKRVEELGLSDRCVLHNGYLETLRETEMFDGATCLLVSHFFLQLEDRLNFLSLIASRLRPGGRLINCDLVSDMSSEKYPRIVAPWRQFLRMQGRTEEEVDQFCDHLGRGVAMLPPVQVENLIAGSGFNAPVQFFQSLLMHAWFADRAGK